MADDRLYIVNKNTGDRVLIAKKTVSWWFPDHKIDEIEAFFKDADVSDGASVFYCEGE